jgi:hypothetical protein
MLNPSTSDWVYEYPAHWRYATRMDFAREYSVALMREDSQFTRVT